MKPPSTVEARVAEELRNWLSSELEQLDVSNTNQFAHHVVTILLHEDLDIEDEPLTTDDDFLLYISSNRRGNTRDNQKQAAVQFLRKAVCCSEPGESEIEGVVDELMVKIEETKIKLSNKSSPKRSVLAPISVNVDNWHGLAPAKSSSSTDQERLYNEAFPSLRSSSKDRTDCYSLLQAGTEDRTGCHSLLQAGTEDRTGCHSLLQAGTEDRTGYSSLLQAGTEDRTGYHSLLQAETENIPKSKQQQQQQEVTCPLSSSASREEAEAWSITWQVVVAALAETPVPFPDSVDSLASDDRRDVAVDDKRDVLVDERRGVIDERRDVIDERRDVAVDDFFAETCQFWALHSAFQACTLLRRFTPSTAALGTAGIAVRGTADRTLRQFCPILISQNNHSDLQNLHLDPRFTSHTDHTQFFRPIKEIRSASPMFESDIEVASIFSYSQTIQRQQEVASIFNCSQPMQQQQEDSSWPTHTTRNTTTTHTTTAHTRTHKIVEYVDQNLTVVITNKGRLSHDVNNLSHGDNLPHDISNFSHDVNNPSHGNNLSHDISDLSHDVSNLSHDVSDLSHDRPCDLEIACPSFCDVQDLTQEPSCSINKFFKPSLLNVCLSEEDSHFLQRALVNTYFSKLHKKTAFQAQVPLSSVSCSYLDPYCMSKQLLYKEECDDEVDESQLVPGCTCLCWLENNCHLGEGCPFSHPKLELQEDESVNTCSNSSFLNLLSVQSDDQIK